MRPRFLKVFDATHATDMRWVIVRTDDVDYIEECKDKTPQDSGLIDPAHFAFDPVPHKRTFEYCIIYFKETTNQPPRIVKHSIENLQAKLEM